MISHELFTADFSGILKTFPTKDGKRYTFKDPVRVVKDQAYTLELNTTAQTVRLIPIIDTVRI